MVKNHEMMYEGAGACQTHAKGLDEALTTRELTDRLAFLQAQKSRESVLAEARPR